MQDVGHEQNNFIEFKDEIQFGAYLVPLNLPQEDHFQNQRPSFNQTDSVFLK